MLPTTGLFKLFNCPFYDKCICERPYCHFKHQKREAGQNEDQVLSELVSQAVHRVLVVGEDPKEETELPEAVAASNSGTEPLSLPSQVTYHPTPISQLNKIKSNTAESSTKDERKSRRHIPIQYSPQRPYSNQIRQSNDLSYVPKSSTATYVPSSIQSLKNDEETKREYVPSSSTEACNVSYLPTVISDDYPRNVDSKSEYVPSSVTPIESKDNANLVNNDIEDFLDEFLNDPNLYESDTNIENVDVPIPVVPVQKEAKKSVKKDERKSEKRPCSETRSGATKRHKSDSTRKHSSKDHSNPEVSSKEKSAEKKDKRHHSRKSSSHSSNSTKDKDNSKLKKPSEKRSDSHKDHKRHSSKDKHSSKKSDRSDSKRSKSESSKSSKPSKPKDSKRSKKDSAPSVQLESLNNAAVTLSNEEIDMLYDDDLSDLDSDDPNSALEECKRIFEEYIPPKVEDNQVKPVVPGINVDKTAPIGKKRIAHENVNHVSRSASLVSAKKSIETPAQVMAKRYQIIKSSLKTTEPSTSTSTETTTTITKRPASQGSTEIHSGPGPVKRIARVPNVMSLINAKKKVEELVKKREDEMKRTPIQTIAKGAKRVPHVPDSSLLDVPMVLEAEKSKLPINVRSRFLQLIVNECKKIYTSKEEIFERALNEELTCYSKCSVISTYRNSAMLAINRLRKEVENKAHGSSKNGFSVISSNASYRPRKQIDNSQEYTGSNFYKNIKKWTLTQQELEENGFPLPGASSKGTALFKDNKPYESLNKGIKRCARCKQLYSIDDHGVPLHREECVYHPLGRFTFRGETKYICCKATVPADGCCTATMHVFDTGDPANIRGFVTTLPPDSSHSDHRNHAVFALDCEMIYTTQGLELARVTVVDPACKTVYESLVKPFGKIIDYNTRFSGLTEEMMRGVTKSLIEVQAALLHMFNSETILIGHSLESDMKSLRIIHETIIDTSVLFPHKLGPPRKNALRNLASHFLNKIIQNSESGHDSAEDAITCIELIIHKLKEELKTR